MDLKHNSWKEKMIAAAFAGTLVFAPAAGFAQGSPADSQTQADVTKALDKKQFKEVYGLRPRRRRQAHGHRPDLRR